MTLFCAVVSFIVGYITQSWAVKGDGRQGLWEVCGCQAIKSHEDWFHAVQAMLSIGLILLLVSLLLIAIYMCIHTVSKNSTIIALVCFCFLSAVFVIIGCIIYGVKLTEHDLTLSWSFAVTLFAALLTIIAGVLSIIQLYSAGVRL